MKRSLDVDFVDKYNKEKRLKFLVEKYREEFIFLFLSRFKKKKKLFLFSFKEKNEDEWVGKYLWKLWDCENDFIVGRQKVKFDVEGMVEGLVFKFFFGNF